MLRKILLGLAVAAAPLAFATSASATTYNIDDIVSPAGYPNGFGSSVFHDQGSGQMSGGTLETPDVLSAGGTWDSTTGAISFDFTLEDGGTVSASGNLMTNAATSSIGYTGLGGSITMTFSGATNIADGMYDFQFASTFHNPEANGTDFSQISLWGDLGTYTSGCSTPACMGVDMRLAISAVPLPAPALLLLAGLGGLGLMRRKR